MREGVWAVSQQEIVCEHDWTDWYKIPDWMQGPKDMQRRICMKCLQQESRRKPE